MTKYSRGAKWEYAVRDWYVANGFTVIRSAGSHGSADLVCFTKFGDVHLVQCKVQSKKRSYTDDVKSLTAVPAPSSWKKLLFVKTLSKTVRLMDVVSGNSTTHTLRSFAVSKVDSHD